MQFYKTNGMKNKTACQCVFVFEAYLSDGGTAMSVLSQFVAFVAC